MGAALLHLASQHGGSGSALVAGGVLALVVLALAAGVLVTLRQRRRVAPRRPVDADDSPALTDRQTQDV